jgi:hypothetical protein
MRLWLAVAERFAGRSAARPDLEADRAQGALLPIPSRIARRLHRHRVEHRPFENKRMAFHTHIAPLANINTIEELEAYPFPRFDEPWRIARFERVFMTYTPVALPC